MQSARWVSTIPRTFEHSEDDTLELKLTALDRGGVSCYVVLTASGRKFEFSPSDFRDAEALAEVAAHFPAPEILRPELLEFCSEEDLALLSPILNE